MSFSLLALVCYTGWMYIEQGPKIWKVAEEAEHAENAHNDDGGENGAAGGPNHLTDLVKQLLKVSKSSWAQAMFVGGLNVFIPIYFLLNMTRQRVRRWDKAMGKKDDDRGARGGDPRFSLAAERAWKQMTTWKWADIFSKICLLGEVYFILQVGVAKLTYVFLSWLNDALAPPTIPFWAVLLASLVIAILLFLLLPPLPGVAVYLFCGIVVASKASTSNIDFPIACCIGVGLALASKILGSLGQALLGRALGTNVKVQQIVGVDKVTMRAVQQILMRRGLNFGKVMTLVGGPDWPTSVLCGVLKIPFFQIVLGTLPIVFVLGPTVLAGAFLTQVVSGEDSLFNTAKNICLAITSVVQPLSTFLFVQETVRVIDECGDELRKPRPEHREVEELSRKADQYNKVYDKETEWKQLGFLLQFLILCATVLMLCSCGVFLFIGTGEQTWKCFRPFSVSGHISDSFEDHGLAGDWTNVVRTNGLYAFGLFVFASILHGLFVMIAAHKASEYVLDRHDDEDTEATTDAELTT